MAVVDSTQPNKTLKLFSSKLYKIRARPLDFLIQNFKPFTTPKCTPGAFNIFSSLMKNDQKVQRPLDLLWCCLALFTTTSLKNTIILWSRLYQLAKLQGKYEQIEMLAETAAPVTTVCDGPWVPVGVEQRNYTSSSQLCHASTSCLVLSVDWLHPPCMDGSSRMLNVKRTAVFILECSDFHDGYGAWNCRFSGKACIFPMGV